MATKKEWGNATWYLFHTLSFKMKDEHFGELKNDFLNICTKICANLPCPDCSEHANAIMKNLDNFYNAKNTYKLQVHHQYLHYVQVLFKQYI